VIALETLLKPLEVKSTKGDTSKVIRRVVSDSRRVADGSMFCAIKGLTVDGHEYITQAIQSGANTILCEEIPQDLDSNVTYVVVDDAAKALALSATVFYKEPSKNLKLIGITGTNGKTTVATLLHDLFSKLGFKSGLVSTVVNKIGLEEKPSRFTTPDPISLNELLAEMVDQNCTHCFMEVSSHAIAQQRITGLDFAGGVFTNLSHDHLDYHKTFRSYLDAKKSFFDKLPAASFALVNIDDKNGKVMVQNSKAKIYEYSLLTLTDFKAKVLENILTGLHLDINGDELFARLVGKFNAYNLLAVFGVGTILEVDRFDLLRVISELKPAQGRFDIIISTDKGITGVVDYAHTPDALKNVLETLHETKSPNSKIITVVGCGGDRDKKKRPVMATIAAALSDKVILTSDNPRSEDPKSILDDMEAGIEAEKKEHVIRIDDRQQAIKTAGLFANTGDVILVAGKGHENYQEIKGVRIPFDDKVELKASLGLN